jgi:hypothetical protein
MGKGKRGRRWFASILGFEDQFPLAARMKIPTKKVVVCGRGKIQSGRKIQWGRVLRKFKGVGCLCRKMEGAASRARDRENSKGSGVFAGSVKPGRERFTRSVKPGRGA